MTRPHTDAHDRLHRVSSADQIRLELPAIAEYGKVARIAATHLARRRGFSALEIDELRVVMDEAVALLGDGNPNALLRVDYSGDSATIIVDAGLRDGDGGGGGGAISAERLMHFGQVVAELVDEYAVDSGARRVHFVKARG